MLGLEARNINQYVTQETLSQKPNHRFYFLIRNILDIILALMGLILTSPIIIIFIIAIKIETKGSAFFLQERVGLDGKLFNIYKLRSMEINAEQNGAQWATKNDPRVTKVGTLIRKTRIDELPQLINILKGDMSLIGPRPERLVFIEKFNNEIPDFKKRLAVKPGLTGWAQVNGGYDITPKEKLNLDLYYIKHLSIVLDFKIIFKTVKVVFTGDGAR